MKLGIMQPYFFPYIGYFQLMNAVDEFLIYDQIEYTKKGWINRNRILVNGDAAVISLPLKAGSDTMDIDERYLSDSWPKERIKLMNRIVEAYRRAPHFTEVISLVESCLLFEDRNLFAFLYNSLEATRRFIDIDTRLRVSSEIPNHRELKGEDKILFLLKASEGTTYVNPIGGVELYAKSRFTDQGFDLKFIKTEGVEYAQFGSTFVPALSIIDVLMFNPKYKVQGFLDNCYSLI